MVCLPYMYSLIYGFVDKMSKEITMPLRWILKTWVEVAVVLMEAFPQMA